jgi:hypothetical protein
MGDERMRKMLLIPLTVCMFAVLPMLSTPAVHATPPTTVSVLADGTIDDPNIVTTFAGDNIITHQWGGGGYLLGPFDGMWIHDEWMVVHLADGIITLNGVWDTPEGVTFHHDGEPYHGTVHVGYRGTVDMATGVFQGTWQIISGTGDLANLRGHGTIWSDPPDPLLHGLFHYHFDPS